MDETLSFQIEGMDELAESLEKFAKRYPDRAGNALEKQAKELRKDVAKMVRNDTDTDGSSKRSLTKLKEYKISKIRGIGLDQQVDISGIAPHFHLVENGHMLTNKSGEPVGKGYVPGYHFIDRARKKREKELPKEIEAVIDKTLREEGFL